MTLTQYTDFHAKLFAHDLTRRVTSSTDRLSQYSRSALFEDKHEVGLVWNETPIGSLHVEFGGGTFAKKPGILEKIALGATKGKAESPQTHQWMPATARSLKLVKGAPHAS